MREIVGCEHKAGPVYDPRSSAILKLGSCRRTVASLPSSYPAAIIMIRKTYDVTQVVLNSRGIARIIQAIGEPMRQTRLALDLAQQGQSGISAHVDTVEPEQDWLAIEG